MGVNRPPHYLDVLPKKVCVEAEPVGGDVKPALDEDVSLEGAGANCKAERGGRWAGCRVLPPPRPSRAGHPPFSTLSSVGMSLNSLWYCELYLLAA